jgi:hypothetical protein
MTFLRAGDVVSIQLDGQFHAACVLKLHKDSGGTFPVIGFYEGRFERIPTAENLAGRAIASKYGCGPFGVVGLTYLPDPANQVVAVATGVVDSLRGASPGANHSPWILTDLMSLQDYIRKLCEGGRATSRT